MTSLRSDVLAGLRAPQKRLPPALFYDDLGSVLFEAITQLPEYEVTRADDRMLLANAPGIVSSLEGPLQVIELGPGHGRKAQVVLEPMLTRQKTVEFVAIDVSRSAIDGCRKQLEALPGVTVTGLESTFSEGLARLPSPGARRRLLMFLGSNLSNFDRHEALRFFRQVRAALAPGDAFLTSVDLVKPVERLLPAYDDALGVTAAFNRNVLVRLNREFGAVFELTNFRHEARWNEPERRIEMHLVALERCDVWVRELEHALHFEPGESIWTESSHRYTAEELRLLGDESHFHCAGQWIDETWPFALTLFHAR